LATFGGTAAVLRLGIRVNSASMARHFYRKRVPVR
jgi:hypothetical protein